MILQSLVKSRKVGKKSMKFEVAMEMLMKDNSLI